MEQPEMKISFFIGSLYGGGAERVVCELASYLSNKNYDIEIITVSDSREQYALHDKVTVFSLSNGIKIQNKFVRKIIKICNLYKHVKKNTTDMYIVFLPDTIRILIAMIRLIKCPIIVSERNCPDFYKKSLISSLVKSYEKASGIVFQTKEAYQFYKIRIKKMPQFSIIPNAVSECFISSEQNISKFEKDNYILGVGRFTEQKNFPLLITAFSKISNDYPNVKLILCGEGKLKQKYIDLIHSLGIDNKVELPGQLKNIHNVMKKARVFVLSSDYEGIPNVLLEAMSCGTPCISTDCVGGGARLLIKDGYNGLLVPTGDIDKLSKSLSYILENNDFADYISENAKNIAKEYSPERIYSQWELFINSVIEDSSGRM